MYKKLTGNDPFHHRLTALLFTPSINLQHFTFTFSIAILSKYFANPSPERNFFLKETHTFKPPVDKVSIAFDEVPDALNIRPR